MKVLSITLALAALLVVAYALPKPSDSEYPPEEPAPAPEEPGYEEEQEPGYEGEEGGEESTTPDPCQEFEEQCTSNEDAMAPGHDSGDNASNGTLGNTTPNPHCHALQQQCSSQNNSTMPGGYTKPSPPAAVTVTHNTQQPTQPTQPSMPTTAVTMTTPGIPEYGRKK